LPFDFLKNKSILIVQGCLALVLQIYTYHGFITLIPCPQ
jgi:hypothetical protein